MKHTQTKFFIMFLSGILFSVFTVFAATITVNTDFTEDAVQYLQSLVLTDSGGTTGIVLDGVNNEIHADTICSTNGNDCKSVADLATGSTIVGGESIWSESGTDIVYTGGNVGVGTDSPTEILDVDGTGKMDSLIIGDVNTATIYMSGSELVIED